MSKGTNTVTQQADPWSGQQPYLQDVFSQAQSQFETGPQQFFPNKTYAGPTQTQLDAETLAKLTALGGQSTLAGSAVPAMQFQLGGPANLATNPYLAGATEAALRPLYSQTQGLLQQARRGATGAGQLGGDRQAILEQGVIGDYLNKAGDISSQMYGGAYQDAMKTQLGALSQLPTAMQSIMSPSQTLAGVGGAEQARIQQAINDQRARFEFGQQAPSEGLSRYANLVQGSILPGTTQSSTNMGGGFNPLMSGAAGLGAYGLTAGAGIAGAEAGTMAAAINPWVAGAMVLGGLLG
jgi:hypothetical protein